MGLFDIFKKSEPATPAAAPSVPAADTVSSTGIDFMAAIEAHVRWKARLENYIDGTTTEKLDVEVVGMDNQCPLGKWIYGAGGDKYNANPLFQEIRESHADFHKCSAGIMRQADTGDKEGAIEALHHGEHFKLSQRIKVKLARLHIELMDAED
ncbi:MAG: CZB domain-containing protein [Sulfuricella sp.]|nr:CZB domain-containing protein [Sulfuricella sp.]